LLLLELLLEPRHLCLQLGNALAEGADDGGGGPLFPLLLPLPLLAACGGGRGRGELAVGGDGGARCFRRRLLPVRVH
jgi:hypothetical protein